MRKILLILAAIFIVFEAFADEADRNACEYARKDSNLETWKSYLNNFPNGQCVSEAINALNRDKNAKDSTLCNQARRQNSYQGWEDYLINFPNGKCNFEAKMNLKKLLKNEWSSPSSSPMNWNDGINYCRNLREGGYSDWRLPTIIELRNTIKNCPNTESLGKCKVGENGCFAEICWSQDPTSCSCHFENNKNREDKSYYSKLGDGRNVLLVSSSTLSDDQNYAWGVSFIIQEVSFT